VKKLAIVLNTVEFSVLQREKGKIAHHLDGRRTREREGRKEKEGGGYCRIIEREVAENGVTLQKD